MTDMEEISPPKTIEEWKNDVIDQLVNYPGIESESLDFKKEANKLHEHICAMANTIGGFLILGIKEIWNDDKSKLLKYEKVGFSKGKEESIQQQIRNAISLLEPTPIIKFEHKKFDKKFLTVIEIKNEISKKPFLIKNTGQCFVRIKDSTTIASRTTILQLFSSSIEQKNTIERLKSVTSLLKESFRHTLSDIQSRSGFISEVDLTLLKNTVASCEWFFSEHNLWGKHVSQGGYEVGINSVLHDIEKMNATIRAYTLTDQSNLKKSIYQNLSSSYHLGGGFEQNTLKFFDKIISLCEEFLKKSD